MYQSPQGPTFDLVQVSLLVVALVLLGGVPVPVGVVMVSAVEAEFRLCDLTVFFGSCL